MKGRVGTRRIGRDGYEPKRVRTAAATDEVGAAAVVITSTDVDQPATEIWAIDSAIWAWTSGEIGAEPAEAAEAA